MSTLYLVPIEPLAERYTESWYRNFPIALTPYFDKVFTIEGETLVNDDIKVGTFLDINSTVHYKSSQLQKIASLFHTGQVEQNSVFFVYDVEFWGIESLRLMADMNKVKIKIAGFLHAGSYTREDAFEIAAPYQQYTEVGWLAALDKVFVGSQYHKNAFLDRRLKPLQAESLSEKIVVTKNPLFVYDYPILRKTKQKKALLTNRLDSEKRPLETLDLFLKLKEKFPDWEFVVTSGRKTLRSNDPSIIQRCQQLVDTGTITLKVGLTKNQYHQELAESWLVVSHSIEEMYGYCIAEALIYGCIPLLRKGLSHDEFVYPELLFETEEQALEKACNILSRPSLVRIPYFDESEGLRAITQELVSLK